MEREDICETCGREVEHEDAKLCTRCWHIQEDLADYIKSPAGWAFVLNAMQEQAAQRDEPWPPTE
jgi:predicted amidophosphoribosyltransferase